MRGARRLATIATLGILGAMAGMTAASAGGGGHCGPSEGTDSTVEMKDACFQPSTVHADAGQSITFVNRDPVDHNVSGTGWGNYENMSTGDRFTTSFADDGIYPFACTLHPGMNGVIVVGSAAGEAAPQPFRATTSPPSDGSGWVLAGAIGLLVGALAGAGFTEVRRRAATA